MLETINSKNCTREIIIDIFYYTLPNSHCYLFLSIFELFSSSCLEKLFIYPVKHFLTIRWDVNRLYQLVQPDGLHSIIGK